MTDRVGQQFGNYRLIRLLGKGGFAEVYLGEHVHLDTLGAIKILDTRLAKDDREQFRNEARTIARLVHPHIVRVFDFGVENDTPYLIMDYAVGGTLREHHPKKSRLALDIICSYVNQAADALQYSHDQNLIHRDVKPDNMLLGRNQEVLLSDFGIALIAQSSRSLSMQEVAGTAAYMAPETLRGRPHQASDQYALGIVVYEWLCGEHPFQGTFSELASQHLFVPPPSLQEKVLTITDEIEQVVMTSLAKDPQQRFKNIRAFARALEQARQELAPVSSTFPTPITRPISTVPSFDPVEKDTLDVFVADIVAPLSPPPPIEEIAAVESVKITHDQENPQDEERKTAPPLMPQREHPARIRRHPFSVRAIFIIGSVLLVVGGTIGLYAEIGASNATNFQATATAGAALATSVLNTREEYNAAITSNGIMFGFDTHHTHVNPHEHTLAFTNVSRLTQTWVYSTNGIISSSPAVANGVVYVGSNDHSLYAIDAVSGQIIWTFATQNVIHSSPALANGSVYVGSDDHSLYAIDVKTHQKRWAFPTRDNIYSSPVVANDVVYFGSEDGSLYAVNARTGDKLWSYPTGGKIGSSPAIYNGIVYVGSNDHILHAIDANSGTKRWAYPTGAEIYSSPAVANGIVYVGSADHNLYAIDALTGQKRWSFPTGGEVDSSPAIVDGVVYVGSYDHSLYAIDALAGQKRWSFPTKGNIYSSPTIANGIIYVGSDDHSLNIMNMSGKQLWSHSVGDTVLSSPAVVGGYVYFGSNDSRLYAFSITRI